MSSRPRRRSVRLGHCGRIESLEPRRLLAVPGSLDPSFSGDGKVILTTTGSLIGTDVAVQSDGKAVVAGRSSINDAGTVTNQFAVARFNVDGTLDASFADGGIARVTLGPLADSFPQAMAIAPDGKIVVVGWAYMSSNANDTDIAVVRYLPSGLLDTSFSGDGKLTMDLNESEAAGSRAEDVAIEPDGQIVIVGESFDGGTETDDFFATRLNVDGSSDGTRFMEFGGEDSAAAVKIDASGRVYIVGNVVSERTVNDPVVEHVALTRFLPGGPTDFENSFSLPGHVIVTATDLMLQSGGKFVITGNATSNNGSREIYVARFTDTGALDTTFGQVGIRPNNTVGPLGYRITDIGENDAAAGITQSPVGVGGFIVSGASNGGWMALKYTDDGAIDTTFGNGGIARVPGFASAAKIAPGPGRRIMLARGDDFATAHMLLQGAREVSGAPFDVSSTEGSTNTASLFVSRIERLPFPTRVFFSIGGTASMSNSRTGTRDWNMPGFVITSVITSTSATGYVDIPANETLVVLTFTPINDSLVESTETAVFTVQSNSSYEIISPSSGTIRITDDDSTNTTTGVGTAKLPSKQVGVGQELQAAVTWTVPTGGWRQLSTIQLRLRNFHDSDALAVLTFDEATNSFSVESTPAAHNPVSLVLSKCTFQAASPTAPTVTILFTFVFNAAATNERFLLDIGATNDAGAFSGFAKIGELHVHKKPKGDGLALSL